MILIAIRNLVVVFSWQANRNLPHLLTNLCAWVRHINRVLLSKPEWIKRNLSSFWLFAFMG